MESIAPKYGHVCDICHQSWEFDSEEACDASADEHQRGHRADWQIVLDALDSLGSALADHNHQWTPDERDVYEKAVTRITRVMGDE